jgi:opacity protein-like surface antigen
MTRLWRLLAMAAALNLTAGAAIAAAQTVMARNVPPGMDVEFLLNDAVVGTAAAGPDGLATIDLKMPEPGEMDANVYVDICEKSRRILVVDRNKRPPSPPAGCDRREVSGLFLVRRINTLAVDVGALQPTMLLVKGSYTPPKPLAEGEEEAPATRRPSPKGLSLFAGGGLGKFRDAFLIACGNAPGCDGRDGGLGYSFGGTFWVTRWLAAEGGYLKARRTTTRGGDDTFTFDSTFDVDVFPVVAKAGIPAGPFRPYGFIGSAYHQSTLDSTQTIDAATQAFAQRTHGWGMIVGGGAEGWITPKVALFGEFSFTKVKGKAEDGGEGFVDDRLRFFGFGVRIQLSR